MKRFRVLVVLVVAAIVMSASSITPSSSAVIKPPGSSTITVIGTLVAVEGVECPVMIFLDNYHLVGNLQGFGPGDTVIVTGATDILTFCQQGTPLRVIKITGA